MTKVEPVFNPYPEFHVPFTFDLSEKALATLEQIAKHRNKSCQGLVREYLSAGMMADLSRLFAETALPTVETVLSKHLPEAEAKAILKEIRDELRPAHMRDEFKPKRRVTDSAPVVDGA